MSVRSQLGVVRTRILSALYRRCVSLGNNGPIVSFTFDDFPRSAYTVGGAILEEFGARGTYYATAGLMNRSNELGELFVRDDVHPSWPGARNWAARRLAIALRARSHWVSSRMT